MLSLIRASGILGRKCEINATLDDVCVHKSGRVEYLLQGKGVAHHTEKVFLKAEKLRFQVLFILVSGLHLLKFNHLLYKDK